jgi:hypothetical protein
MNKEALLKDEMAFLAIEEEPESVELRGQAAADDVEDLQPLDAAPTAKKETPKLSAAQKADITTLEETALEDIKYAKKFRELEKILRTRKILRGGGELWSDPREIGR